MLRNDVRWPSLCSDSFSFMVLELLTNKCKETIGC